MLARLFQRDRSDEAKVAHALRGVPLFRDVPTADLVEVWRKLEEVRAPAGSVICQRGEPGDRFYIIQTGEIDVRLGLDEASVLVRRLLPGDFVGEMALLTGAPRSADVVASTDAILWSLDRSEFDEVIARHPLLLRALNHYLCERIAYVTRALEQHELQGNRSPAGMRFGPYRVVAQLGSGGMAAVYSAVHVASNHAVALKVLPIGWGLAEELQKRLGREANVLRQISHPNVVRLLEVGTVDDRLGGGLFLAMEWLPNALDRTLRARFPDPLPTRSALTIARGAAAGLAAVHSRGIVHRDVKPSNVMLRADGTPVLVDFGLAMILSEVVEELRLTPENVIVGTADYVSPEQVEGTPLDGRSDVYSLGVVLYEMLAGYVPYADLDSLETLHAHVEKPPPPLPESVPATARAIVERSLRKRPEDRFPSADALMAALDEALEDSPLS
jgi:CRP-like cAMP-binding protein